MMTKMQQCLYILALILLLAPLQAMEHLSLTINLISHSLENGAGKQADVAILKEEAERLGHRVQLFDYFKVDGIEPADINIFLAQLKPEWFSFAKLNWFIPNPECCLATLEELKQFDLVLCKTNETLRLFKPICKEVYYLGFTSHDCLQSLQTKNFSEHLHVAGKSRMKGTENIFRAWQSHPKLPRLTVIKHRPMKRGSIIPRNLKLINKRISLDALSELQNKCGVHLCPSKTEGFGHYLMEAMSTGAVVITTDAPPMNEFVKDDRCRVSYRSTGKKKYATTYTVDEKELAAVVKNLQKLPPEELQRIGQNNREEYLRRTIEFKQNFEGLLDRTVQGLQNK